MIKHAKAFSLIELIVVVVIMGILAALAIAIPRGQLERARETEAQTQLKLIWAAEKDYYVYNGRYTDDWDALNVYDPNINSINFTYTVEGTPSSFLIKATRKGTSPPSGFQIDSNGKIEPFP